VPSAAAPGEAPAAEATDAPKEEKKPRFTAQVETTGPCTRLIKIEVEQERVKEEVDKSYGELRKTVVLRGFRPGHVPRHVLERRFSKEVTESVRQSLVDECLEQAVKDHSLRLALPASVDYAAITLDPDKPLSFEAKLEVFPEFTIDNYKGLAVERPAVEVTEADVAQALTALRARHGSYQKVQEGAVQKGDVPVCHAIALVDGQEAWRENELPILFEDETVGDIPVPGIEAALVGAAVGDTKTFVLRLPDDFRVEALRGKDVTLEVTIDELRRVAMPEATDDWARSLHFDDLDDLRAELRSSLRRRREQEADEALHDRIADKLLELTDFDVPEGLVHRLVARAKDQQRMALLYRGVPREEIDKAIALQEKRTREASVRQCKLYFIYEKIAEAEKLFVTEDEVTQRIEAIALNYRRRPNEVKAELEAEGRLGALRQQMREEKVREFLVKHAVVTQATRAAAAAEPPTGAKPEGPAS